PARWGRAGPPAPCQRQVWPGPVRRLFSTCRRVADPPATSLSIQRDVRGKSPSRPSKTTLIEKTPETRPVQTNGRSQEGQAPPPSEIEICSPPQTGGEAAEPRHHPFCAKTALGTASLVS